MLRCSRPFHPSCHSSLLPSFSSSCTSSSSSCTISSLRTLFLSSSAYNSTSRHRTHFHSSAITSADQTKPSNPSAPSPSASSPSPSSPSSSPSSSSSSTSTTISSASSSVSSSPTQKYNKKHHHPKKNSSDASTKEKSAVPSNNTNNTTNKNTTAKTTTTSATKPASPAPSSPAPFSSSSSTSSSPTPKPIPTSSLLSSSSPSSQISADVAKARIIAFAQATHRSSPIYSNSRIEPIKSADPTSPPPPATPPVPHVSEISPVWSFGEGYLAGLGNGLYLPRPHPLPIHALQGLHIKEICSGWSRNAAITHHGSVITWGWRPFMNGPYGAINVARYARYFPSFVRFLQRLRLNYLSFNGAKPLNPTRVGGWGLELEESDAPPSDPDTTLQAVNISTGADWTAILANNGQVYTYGMGFYGQLGHNSQIISTYLKEPRMITGYQNAHPNETLGLRIESDKNLPSSFPNSPIVAVSCGFSHMLLLTKNGQVYSCGRKAHGGLGITHIYRDGPSVFLPHLIPVTDAYSAGEQGAGEIGVKYLALEKNNGEEAVDSQFLRAQNDPAIVDHYVGPMIQVATGMKHSLFLNSLGEVYASGNNHLNELGNGKYHPLHGLIKVNLPLLNPVQTVSDSIPNSILARRKRRLSKSHIFKDTNEDFFLDTRHANEKIISIAAGHHHNLALSNRGYVYAWGFNSRGQCGRPCRGQYLTSFFNRWKYWLKQKDLNLKNDFSNPNISAFDAQRAHYAKDLCEMPQMIEWEKQLGVKEGELGRVIKIQAGFHDSVLITDKGNCILFGGAGTAHDSYAPFLFRLNQTNPDINSEEITYEKEKWSNLQVNDDDVSPPPHPDPDHLMETSQQYNQRIQQALQKPYRIKSVAFGLSHILALVEGKDK